MCTYSRPTHTPNYSPVNYPTSTVLGSPTCKTCSHFLSSFFISREILKRSPGLADCQELYIWFSAGFAICMV